MQKLVVFFLIPVALVICIFLAKGFFDSQTLTTEEGITKVMVTVPPQKYLVEKIGGSHIDISVLIPPGASHETYEPTPKDIQALSQADVYFGIGKIGFEVTQMPRIQEMYPDLKIIDTSVGVSFRTLENHFHEGDEENHDASESAQEEVAGEEDPHIWLSPKTLKIQAKHITETLISSQPEKEQEFLNGEAALFAELDAADVQLREILLPLKGKTVLVYHPAFGYLLDEYGLVQEHIEIEGREPALSEVEAIIKEAKADGVRVIFVQEQFSQSVARTIAEELDGVVVSLDPLKENIIQNFQDLANTLKENLQK